MHDILDCFPQIIVAQKEIILILMSISTLLDQFLQDWNSSVHNSPKAFNYRIFKTDFKFEEYFNILDKQNSLLLCKFRTTNHKLPIEKGRWLYWDAQLDVLEVVKYVFRLN
jgi:hypothetical protein